MKGVTVKARFSLVEEQFVAERVIGAPVLVQHPNFKNSLRRNLKKLTDELYCKARTGEYNIELEHQFTFIPTTV